MCTVLLFGNPDLPEDSLPVRLQEELKKRLPEYRFRSADPNELDLPQTDDPLWIIDTIEGLKNVRFVGIEEIAALTARATAHDFDLGTYLLLARKLNKNIDIRLIGIPMRCPAAQALEDIVRLLSR